VAWAEWDEELLALELQELSEADFDLSLTGFNPREIDGLLAIPDEERANAAPPLPEHPVSASATCGFAASIESFVQIPPAPKPWRGSLASGSLR
jgi:ParB-like chromosome segregation protein Spo0J